MADVHFSVGMLKSSEALLLLCCSILGMHIFGCKFSLKTETGDTVPDRKNFDSLLWAIVTVFQVIYTSLLEKHVDKLTGTHLYTYDLHVSIYADDVHIFFRFNTGRYFTDTLTFKSNLVYVACMVVTLHVVLALNSNL